MELPRFVMFKSPVSNNYLCDRIIKSEYDGTLISFAQLEGWGTDAVHEVEMAKCEGRLIHIKSIRNGKYWSQWSACKSEGYYNVSAVVDKPKEDKSSKDCTLFKPSFSTTEGVNTIRLEHLMNGKFSFVRLHKDGKYCSVGDSKKLGEPISLIADSWEPRLIEYFKAADLKVTVSDMRNRLPSFVVFKSEHNGKYLRCDEHWPYLLKFTGKDAQSPYTKHKVEMAKCGYGLVHIKCCSTDKYWGKLSETDNWIAAQADDKEEDLSKRSCTLFYPYYPKEGDDVVQLQFSQLGEYPIIQQEYCLSLPTGKSSQTTPVSLTWEQPNNPPKGKPSKPQVAQASASQAAQASRRQGFGPPPPLLARGHQASPPPPPPLLGRRASKSQAKPPG